MRLRPLFPALLLLASARGVAAQYQTRSWLHWRTIETGRFSLHFPDELEPWARTVAGTINGIDTAVSRAVGFTPKQHIEVVIDDPFRIPNGSAWPLLDQARLVFWATPPNPREDIGTFVSWADLLTTHEFAHLAHLLRPTRNPFRSFIWNLAPVEIGPISRKAPRWAIEGYATYIEGRITGSGRPHGIWRPTILRQWALEGALPTYRQLNNMGGMYGGEFAYLAGSSYLEWLVARRGDSSLVDLWRRLSARRNRGFVEAFTGVYGEPPDILYGRFTAELTAAAKQREAELRGAPADTGTMVQHLARETGDPAISRDGGRAAIMLASATRPARVVIWRTIAEPDTLAERVARALLARDPEDVAPYRPFPPAKKALATLYAVGNQPYQDPRFFADGRVLVWRNSAVGDGSWMPDLYAWDPQRDKVRRLTRGKNVRQGDPSPDGSTIVATQCGAGKCDLVLVDVRSGVVSLVGEGSDTKSFYRPRFSPDGRTIAVTVHDDGYWRIGLVDVATRVLRVITTDNRGYFDATFTDDSTLIATADENAVLNLVRLRTDGRVVGRITSVTGAAVAPEPNPADGSVWFLSLHARGWDVRSARAAAAPVAVVATNAPTLTALPSSPVGPTKRYSPDRTWIWFGANEDVGDGNSTLYGLVNTDPAGTRELLIQGQMKSISGGANPPWDGVHVSLTSRARVSRSVAVFGARQSAGYSRWVRGGAFWLDYANRRERFAQRIATGASATRVRRPEEESAHGSLRLQWFGEGEVSATRFGNGRRTTAQLALHGSAGRIDDRSFGRLLATASITSTEIPFAFTAQRGLADPDVTSEKFTIGGPPPTLLPPGAFPQFITLPALPPYFIGSQLETYRLSVPLLFGVRAYGWAGRAFESGEAAPFDRVAGAELTMSIAAIPVLGTPTSRATIGFGNWLNRRASGRLYDNILFTARKRGWQVYATTQFGDWAR